MYCIHWFTRDRPHFIDRFDLDTCIWITSRRLWAARLPGWRLLIICESKIKKRIKSEMLNVVIRECKLIDSSCHLLHQSIVPSTRCALLLSLSLWLFLYMFVLLSSLISCVCFYLRTLYSSQITSIANGTFAGLSALRDLWVEPNLFIVLWLCMFSVVSLHCVYHSLFSSSSLSYFILSLFRFLH